jgi:hypothetical protein
MSNPNFLYSDSSVTDFNPLVESSTQSNGSLAIVLNINTKLTAKPDGSRLLWYPSLSLIPVGTATTNNFVFQDNGNNRYLRIQKPTSTSDTFIQPKFYSTSTTTTSDSSAPDLPFSYFISMYSNVYSKATNSSIKIKNSSTVNLPIQGLKLYLGTTDINYVSTSKSPISIQLSKYYSDSQTQSSINIINNSNTTIYSPNSETIISPNEILEIKMSRNSNSTTNSSGKVSSGKSILIVDLKNLLYVSPSTGLVLTNPANLYYSNVNQSSFVCTFTPQNFNAETLNNKYLSFAITGKDTIVSKVINGTATFTISESITSYTPGTYNVIVSYDPNYESSDKSMSNKTNTPTNSSPNAGCHYLQGSISGTFTVSKQRLTIVPNAGLNASYSILKSVTFNNFTIKDTDFSQDMSSTEGTVELSFEDEDNSNNKHGPISLPNSRITSIGPFNIPSTMIPSKRYKLTVKFTPNNSSNIDFVTSDAYIFATESPILENTQSLNLLGYKDENTVSVYLRDSSNNKYDQTRLLGDVSLNIYKNNSSILNLSNISFDPTTKTYSRTFSPQSLNLLLYGNDSNDTYRIYTSFDANGTINDESKSDLTFKFKGVNISKTLTSNDNNNISVYDDVTISAKLLSDSLSLSNTDLSGKFYIQIPGQPNNIQLVSSDNINYSITFKPNDYGLNTSNSPINTTIIFTPDNSEITSIKEESLQFQIKPINQTITIVPLTNTDNLYQLQEYTITVNGMDGHNDAGTLKIDGLNNHLVYENRVNINGSITTTIKPIDLLNNDMTLLQSTITGTVTWTPDLDYIYEVNSKTFTVNLSKTSITFGSITVSNNNCTWQNEMSITGSISTTYSETVSGNVFLYNNEGVRLSDENGIQVEDNHFTIPFSSDHPEEYNLYIKFIPTYASAYNNSQSSNFTATFTKVTISPTLNLINSSSSPYTPTNGLYQIYYTDNFEIKLSNVNIPNSKAKFNIGKDNTSVYSSVDLDLLSNNTSFLSSYINLLKINSDNVNSYINIEYLLTFTVSSYSTSLYQIENSSLRVKFILNPTLPTFTYIKFYEGVNEMNMSNLRFNYNQNYTIHAKFNLVEDSANNVIPITGNFNIIYNGVTKTLNENYTVNNENDRLIVSSFKPSDLGITSNTYNYYFSFVPNDPNLKEFQSVSSTLIVSASSLSSVYLNIQTSDIYYQQTFTTTLSLTNPGLDGNFQIYCTNPIGGVNQLLSTILISSDVNNQHYQSEGEITLENTCNAITFDITSNTSSQEEYSLYVRFNSTSNNYESNTFTGFSVIINKINVYLKQLIINGEEQSSISEYFNDGINKYTGDILNISGKVFTSDNNYVTSGHIDLLTNIVGDNIISSIPVNNDGTFSSSIVLNSSSLLYISANIENQGYGELNLVYNNTKNYTETSFEQYPSVGSPGMYVVSITDIELNYNVSLAKSTITNSYWFPYQEDLLIFTVNINSKYTNVKDGTLDLYLTDTNGASLGKSPYALIIREDGLDTSIATISLNPKTEGLLYDSSGYSANCIFTGNGFKQTISNYVENIYTQLTQPVVNVTLYQPGTTTEIDHIDYESSVDILVQVQTSKPIVQGVNQTRDIVGYSILYIQTKTGVKQVNFTYNGESHSSHQFNSDSSTGIKINYAPKGNLGGITDLSSITGFYVSFNANSDKDNWHYNSASKDKSFTIKKYSPSLVIDSIIPLNDITHNNPNDNNVDDENVYYENNKSSVKFFGVINYDEQFTITTTLDNNNPNHVILGTLSYSYSNGSVTYNPLTPLNHDGTDDVVTATFHNDSIPINNTNSYLMKVEFTPNEPNFYESKRADSTFNVYESNVFGFGTLSYPNNSGLTQKTISYNSSTFDVKVSFSFDDSIEQEERKCLVQLYHDNFNNSNLINTGNPVYLTNSSKEHTFTLKNNILACREYSNPYAIKALFTPVVDTTTGARNNNLPIIAYEYNPLTLYVIPTVSIESPANNFSYNYDTSFDLTIKFHSGTSDLLGYNSLSISGFNYLSSFTLNSNGNVDPDITISNFNTYLNPSPLIPGNYSYSICATNNNAPQTDSVSKSFTVNKTPVTLTGLINNYYIYYKNSLSFNISIGNYPIDNGEITIKFTNSKISSSVISYTVNHNSLTTTTTPNVYLYSLLDTSLLTNGIYSISYDINNQNYTSDTYKDTSNNLFVNSYNNSRIVLDKVSPAFYSGIYSSEVTINANVYYNIDSNLYPVNDGTLSFVVNNGTAIPVSYTDGKFTFTTNTENLNIGVNEVAVYFSNPNYYAPPVFTKINVLKETVLSTNYNLTHDSTQDTLTTFTLQLSNITTGLNVAFYTKSSINKLTPTKNSNNYTFNFSELTYGSTEIFAIINSTKFDVTTNTVTVTKNRNTLTVQSTTSFNSSYKSGTPINITYSTTPAVSEGDIEIYKVINNKHELISSFPVQNGSVTYNNYILYSNDENHSIQFYSKFTNSVNYLPAESSLSNEIHINHYYSTTLTDNYNTVNNFTNDHYYKVNTNVTLSYTVTQSTVTDHTDGVIEFHKIFNGIDEILGYSDLNSQGTSSLTHMLVNLGSVSFYGKYVNAKNYSGSDTSQHLKRIDVNKYYPVTITDNSTHTTTHINDSIILSYEVKNSLTNDLIREGIVEFHKKIGGTDIDEILTYSNVTNGVVTHIHKFTTTVENISFYAKFKNSDDYEPKSSSESTVNVIKKEVMIRHEGTLLNNYLYGQEITLQYSIIDSVTEDHLTEGSVEIYKVNGAIYEIIYQKNLTSTNNGNINTSYKLIDIGTVGFYIKFDNSVNYADNQSAQQTINILPEYSSIITDSSVLNNTYVNDKVTLQYSVNYINGENHLPVDEGVIELHKVSHDLDQIIHYEYLSSSNNGSSVSYQYTLIDYDTNVSFYAKFCNSVKYGDSSTHENQKTIYVNKQLGSHITDTTHYENYTNLLLNDQITLVCTVVDDNGNKIREGTVEFHKVFNDTDEIIGYISASSIDLTCVYKLVDHGKVSFYMKFNNSLKYLDVSTQHHDLTVLQNLSPTHVSYNATGSNPLVSGNTYKLGDLVSLSYTATYNGSAITEGYIIIYEKYNNDNKIIANLPVDNNGTVTVEDGHKLIYPTNYTGEVSFYAQYTNSNRYASSEPSESISIYIIEQYDTVITDESGYTTTRFQVGKNVTLNYKVSSGDHVINEGIVEFHKVVYELDTIIGYNNVVNGNSSLNYNVYDINNSVKFYGNFINSISFKSVSNSNAKSPIFSMYESYTTATTISSSVDRTTYGSTITLSANVTTSGNDTVVNSGFVEFYRVIDDDSSELISSVTVNNGLASVEYQVNNIEDIVFSASYGNSNNNKFDDSVAFNKTILSEKASPTDISITIPSDTHYLDIITVTANVTFSSVSCSSNTGNVTFDVNGVSTLVELIDNVASLKLLLDSVNDYTINATFNGNDFYNPTSTTQSSIVTPTINTSVYNGLTFTGLPIPLLPSNSLSFTNSWVNIGSPSDYSLQQGTIECWVKAPSNKSLNSGTYVGIFTKQHCYGIFLCNTNGCFGAYDFYDGYSQTTNTDLRDGKWHHVALSFNNGVTNGSRLYVDGEIIKTFSYRTKSSGSPLMLGQSDTGGSQNLNGNISIARVWNVVRSQSDIQSNMYNILKSGDGLVGAFNFTNGSGTTLTNSISGKPNGIIKSLSGVSWSSDTPANLTQSGNNSLTIDASLNLVDSPSNKYILNNSGYVTFTPQKNGSPLFTTPYVAPLINGHASANLPNCDTVSVVYSDINSSTPNLSITYNNILNSTTSPSVFPLIS